MAVMSSAYDEDEVDGETSVVLLFSPRIAPIKVAVFPLLKNNHEILQKSEEIYNSLKKKFISYFDVNGAIGRWYRRMDEVGTSYFVTIDFETLENNTFSVPDRDTTKQERMTLEGLFKKLYEECLRQLICLAIQNVTYTISQPRHIEWNILKQ